jgi:hypothetical protein
MYHLGGYKSSDKEKALRWYEVAARNGSVWAQLALASFFDQGTLVERDNVQAFFWFTVLAARPLEFEDRTSLALLEVAITSLVVVRDRMTGEQLADELYPKVGDEMRAAHPGDDRVAIFHEGGIRHERGYSCPASPTRDLFRGCADGDFTLWRTASSGTGG